MKNIYPDTVKDFPPNYLPPRGNHIHVICFVYSAHAGDKITFCYQSGTILYFNTDPIFW